ncbi:MAG: ABC transporter permease [Thermoleophilia bacterium]
MNDDVVIAVIVSGVALMTPVLWAALGEAISEQAGVLNIGIEGVMLFGALTCAWGIRESGIAAGLLLSLPVGAALGAILAYLWVSRGTDQIVSGIMFNLLALGATTLLFEEYLSGVGVVTSLDRHGFPGLSQIPWIGEVFEQNWTVWLALAAVPLVYALLRHTWLGLAMRSAGEKPRATETAGVSVAGIRYAAVILSTTLMSFGGAALIASTSGGFVSNVTAGQGFVALAVVVLARWNPFLCVAGALLFGLTQALQFQAQSLGVLADLPPEAWLSLPYLVAIVAVIAARSSRYPNACGVPYEPLGATR